MKLSIRIARRRTGRALPGPGEARRTARLPRASFTTTRSGRATCFRGWAPPRSARARLGLGTSVVDPYTRHAALLAQATATLAELAPGRFRVIMGSGSHFETLPGYGSPKPVAGLREAAELMQRLWRGEKVTHRRRGGEVQGRIARLEADRDPAALYRQPRAANPPARWRRSPTACWSAASPLRPASTTPRSTSCRGWKHPSATGKTSGCAPGSTSRCSIARTIRCRRASSRGVSFAFWSSRKVLGAMADTLAPDASDEFRTFIRDAPHEWSPPIMDELRRLIPRGDHRQSRAGRHGAAGRRRLKAWQHAACRKS